MWVEGLAEKVLGELKLEFREAELRELVKEAIARPETRPAVLRRLNSALENATAVQDKKVIKKLRMAIETIVIIDLLEAIK